MSMKLNIDLNPGIIYFDLLNNSDGVYDTQTKNIVHKLDKKRRYTNTTRNAKLLQCQKGKKTSLMYQSDPL